MASFLQNLKNWERLQWSSAYMQQVYGDAQAHLHVDTTNYVTEREMFGDFGLGKCFFEPPLEDEVNFEVTPHNDLFKEDIRAVVFNPKVLPYEKRLAWHFREFCYKTSAHGIPMIGQAPNRYYRAVWIVLFVTCMSMLYYNAQSVLQKYKRNEKTVDIQLKFDTSPFPAITICNLNPYKASLANNVDLVRRTLKAFHAVMGEKEEEKNVQPVIRYIDEENEEERRRKKRKVDNFYRAYFEPVRDSGC